jgi:hypothetical protein
MRWPYDDGTMKVLDLRCANGHGFEGWFASEADYTLQDDRGLLGCPMCANTAISRLPSAPRLNLSGAREVVPMAPRKAQTSPVSEARPSPATPEDKPMVHSATEAQLQAAWLATVRHLVNTTEDVGPRFTEEVRRIHYGETPHRGIRGQASAEDRQALREEGIETMAIPVPQGLEGPLQ